VVSIAVSAPHLGGVSSRSSSTSSKRLRKTDPGRYQAQQSARVPANGFGTSATRSRANVDTTVAVVPDPFSAKDRIAVTVNRRVDLLEYEYSNRRLTEAAYRTGRIVQATFERATGRSQSSWSLGDRVDAWSAKEMQMISSLQRAEAVQTMMARIVRSVGQIGARFLRAILSEGKTYEQLAEARGRTSERGRTAAAERFRTLLEDLAEDWAATGLATPAR
jgi:hypothetical protein